MKNKFIETFEARRAADNAELCEQMCCVIDELDLEKIVDKNDSIERNTNRLIVNAYARFDLSKATRSILIDNLQAYAYDKVSQFLTGESIF